MDEILPIRRIFEMYFDFLDTFTFGILQPHFFGKRIDPISKCNLSLFKVGLKFSLNVLNIF